ncbi:MAG: hypothetical protein K2I95_05260 [Treponemataceae bacterium]|nr:hypothetical protein [Treponemataceae bacterium]
MENSQSLRKNSCYFPQDLAKSQLIISRYPNKYKFGAKNFLPTIDGLQSEVSDGFAQFRKVPSEASDGFAQVGKMPSEPSDTSTRIGIMLSEVSDGFAQFGIMQSEPSDTSAQSCAGKIQRIKTTGAYAAATFHTKGDSL